MVWFTFFKRFLVYRIQIIANLRKKNESKSRFNHYRIVAIVLFKIKRVYIRWVGNHKDYSRLKNIDKL
ncbi:type II toxin-antitoxin system HigB family toxin [Maribacter algicola]|uniref:Type II toxin-antitoxin system HigB family toxin n=1 Tax=Meishania litoralis TaxID=3434685 RepID=A0ACC7LK54_9FLAO